MQIKVFKSFLNAARVVWRARAGVALRDKRLALLIGALNGIGRGRAGIRGRVLHWIDRMAVGDFVLLHLRIPNARPQTVSMRRANESDYLVAGELVINTYDTPAFEPDTIIDGGANIGTFAANAGLRYPRAKIICYEPDESNFLQLQTNIRLNALQNTEAKRMGLWSETRVLYFQPHAMSYAGLVTETPTQTAVPCVLPEADANTWLKLDIEGAEYEVLPALFKLGRFPRHITLELHFFNKKGDVILDLLRRHGYSLSGNLDPSFDCTVITARRSAITTTGGTRRES